MSNTRNKDVIIIKLPINVNWAAALGVGIVTGIGFHPIDLAFYRRSIEKIKDRHNLFTPKYWVGPTTGLRNTLYQRIISNGIYFAFQGELNSRLLPIMKDEWQYSDKVSTIGIGLLAGAATGFFSNASYAVKFYTFTHKPKGKPLENALRMWKQGGPRPFRNGIYPGVTRDATFGLLYEFTNLILDEHFVKKIQNQIPEENKKAKDFIYFSSRFFSASLATAASSPWNYARNMQFKTPPHKKAPLVFDIWCAAWAESKKTLKASSKKAHLNQTVVKPSFFPMTRSLATKFNVGLGTVRCAAGFAIQQLLFKKFSKLLHGLDDEADDHASKRKNRI